jgi:hypothetical protein
MKFAAKPFQGVSVEGGGKTARIVFSKQCKPCTVMPLDPVTPGSHAYEVRESVALMLGRAYMACDTMLLHGAWQRAGAMHA